MVSELSPTRASALRTEPDIGRCPGHVCWKREEGLCSVSVMSLERTGTGLQEVGQSPVTEGRMGWPQKRHEQGGALSSGEELGGALPPGRQARDPFDQAQMPHGPSCLPLLSNSSRGLAPCWHYPD